ncbi:MAG: ATP-binding protein [Acetobacteraceae bacterium]|nr:ATP-binding protein [Acetobacteraceae bacterium]
MKVASRLTGVSGSAIGLLRVLLAASLIVPALLFVVISWVNYRSILNDANRELERTSEVAREHASKAFEGQSQAMERVNDLVRGTDEAAIVASEPRLHDSMAAIISHLPQVQSVLAISKTGRPLVSASIYPVPSGVNVRETDFFKAVMGGTTPYVSKLQMGLLLRQQFFGLAGLWRDSSGAVQGVIDVAVSPAFFSDFYGALVDEEGNEAAGKIIALVRDDGQILARFPAITGVVPKIVSPNPFLDAIRTAPNAGTFLNRSVVDRNAPVRLYAYRKVEAYPLYVVTGRSWHAILGEWYWSMADHLLFGIPATAFLFMITRTALVRTRREEEALARANAEMTRRHLAEDALLRTQRLEAVGQMTGGIAHDFNNLLTVIVGNAEMIGKRVADMDARRLAANIGLAARRGADITQKLLAFSGKQIVNPETVNLNRRLQEFKPLLDRVASEAIRIDLDLDAGLDPVRLDPGQFEAAIVNLVGNARDAMPDGGQIRISTGNAAIGANDGSGLAPGRYVRVVVSDTGSGMDPATAAKAFEPFFTTKEIGKGTGLGLSQVYGFARQAGGSARIETAPGGGTAVTLILPRSHSPPRLDRSDADVIPIRTAGKGEVVLVVEDEPSVLEMAVECLEGMGYATLTAADAQAALAQLRHADRVDVLFSDIVMPGGMNGVQLAIEAMRLRPNLKVLMTSGYTATSTRQELPLGVPLLMKPYDSWQLGKQVRSVLNGRRADTG